MKVVHSAFQICIYTLFVALSSCHDFVFNNEELPNREDAPEKTDSASAFQDTYFYLSVHTPASGATRTADQLQLINGSDEVTDYLGRTIHENDINSISVFLVDVVDINGKETEDWSTLQKQTVIPTDSKPTLSSDGYYTHTLQLCFNTTNGKKHLYAGVNLTDALYTNFINGTNLFCDLTSNYDGLMQQLVSPEQGIAMFCTEAEAITTGITDGDNNDGSASHPYQQDITLTRMVSKVLVTCVEDTKKRSGDITYAQVETDLDDTYRDTYSGWIKMSDIHYRLHNVNRATYFVQRTDDNGAVTDPNYETSGRFLPDGNTWTYTPGTDEGGFTDIPTDNSMPVEVYDAQRIDGTSTPYSGGLYCTENTFSNVWDKGTDKQPFTEYDWYTLPTQLVTYVSISVVYTPAVLYGSESSTTPRLFTDEAEAHQYLIDESAVPTLEEATYYCLAGKEFFTYLGMLKRIDDEGGLLTQASFTQYTNGVGHYNTYIDGNSYKTQHTLQTLERNNYYLLACTAIHVPGTQEHTLQAVTLTTAWKPWTEMGNINITVKPN